MEKHLPKPFVAWKPRDPQAKLMAPEYRTALVDAHEVVAISDRDTWAGPVATFLARFVPLDPSKAFC